MEPFLTRSQIGALKYQHKHEPSGKVRDRIKAVLLANMGWTYAEIAEALFLDETTVSQHLEDYRIGHRLTLESGGSSSRLDESQTQALLAELEHTLHPTTGSIQSWIRKSLGVKYSRSGVTAWLHEHSFSYKQPVGTPAKADPVKQEEFRVAYEDLKKSLGIGDVVVFCDASHPTMATKISHGWIRTGFDRPIPTTASRTRVNLLGSLELKTMKFTGSEHETVNSLAMGVHFKELRLAYPQAPALHVIIDNVSYCVSKQTKAAAVAAGITLHFLPTYSPNLNPIERLWKVLAERVRNNVFFSNAAEFRRCILEFFKKTWHRIKNQMRSRINDNFQTVRPAF